MAMSFLKKFNNLNIYKIQKRFVMLELDEREIEWWHLSEEERNKYFALGFTDGCPGPDREMWNKWYTEQFLTKRPKTLIKRFFYIYFIEAIVMFIYLYEFPFIKRLYDSASSYYWANYIDELEDLGEDYHIDYFACWQWDNWNKQFFIWGWGFLLHFLLWDFILERWVFTECIYEEFIDSLKIMFTFFKSFFL